MLLSEVFIILKCIFMYPLHRNLQCALFLGWVFVCGEHVISETFVKAKDHSKMMSMYVSDERQVKAVQEIGDFIFSQFFKLVKCL